MKFSKHVLNAISEADRYSWEQNYEASRILRNAAESVKSESDRKILHILSGVLSLSFTEQEQDFSPLIQLADGRRSFAICDIEESDYVVLTAPAASVPSAAVSDVTISGTKGNAISNTDVTVTLTNDTFENSLSGDWITNLPAGLTQSVARTGDTTATITVSGTPTATSTAQMEITIPAAQLVTSDNNLTVTANANAKYSIAAPTWTVAMEMSRNVQSGNTQNLKSSAAPVRLPAVPAPTPGTSQVAVPAGCAYRS